MGERKKPHTEDLVNQFSSNQVRDICIENGCVFAKPIGDNLYYCAVKDPNRVVMDFAPGGVGKCRKAAIQNGKSKNTVIPGAININGFEASDGPVKLTDLLNQST